jgi:flagellar motor switch protein FliG
MEAADKARLLKNLRVRNPSLAKELTESCISFESIWDLNDESLKTIVSQVQPAILGLALSLVHVKNQRRVLSLISREMALKAFDIMQKDLTSNRSECMRAQQKILELAMNLHRNRIIQFY